MPRPKSILDDDESSVDLTEDSEVVNGSVRPRNEAPTEPTPIEYVRHRQTMKKRFSAGWNPPKKISREAMDGLRDLHRLDPQRFTTSLLAEKFRISPEAVRRILKSRWNPSDEKRVKQVEKERKGYDEFISLNRLRERFETSRLLALNKPVRTPGHNRGSEDGFTFK